jgi:hypothetical protein
MKKAEIFSLIGHCVALSVHFLLNMNIISLFVFCTLSLVAPIAFAIAGYFNKDRTFIAGQIGWLLIALIGIYKNI